MDYYCYLCGGRTGMMGHSSQSCDPQMLNVIRKVQDFHPTTPRERIVNILGRYNIGELA